MKRKLAALAVLAVLSTPVKADLVCPSGSLADFWSANAVWKQYAERNSAYVKQLLRRMANNLAATVSAHGTTAQQRAASSAGADNAMVMTRMFEEGFTAATDIVNAYCVPTPDAEPWNSDIKQHRRQSWCKEWPDAHFCFR